MATLNRFLHYNSGGIEQADNGNAGSPLVSSAASLHRTGDYGLTLDTTSDWVSHNPFLGISAVDAHHGFILYVKFASTPTADARFFETRASGGQVLRLWRTSSSTIIVTDTAGTTQVTSTGTAGNDVWHKIRVYYNLNNSGAVSLELNDATPDTGTGDFDAGSAIVDELLLWGTAENGRTAFDLCAYYTGVNSTSKLGDLPANGSGADLEKWSFLGDGSPTTSGTALDAGSWPNTQERPFSATNQAEYTGGTSSGFVVTDGTNGGPNGSGDIDGDSNILAGHWMWEMTRGNGGGTQHQIVWGNDVDGQTTDNVTIGSTSAPGDIFEVLSVAATRVPLSTEEFAIGMAKDGGARDMRIVDCLCTVLHESITASGVTIAPSTASLTLSGQTPAVGTGAIVSIASPSTLTLSAQTPEVGTGAVVAIAAASALTLSTQTPTIETGVAVEPATASLTLSGQTPTIETGVNIEPATASLTLSAQTPEVGTGVGVLPGTAALTLSAQTPTINIGVNAEPATASLALSAQTPTIETGVAAEPASASLTLSAQTPTIATGVGIEPATASLTLSAQTPQIQINTNIAPATASLTLSAQTPEVGTGVNIQPGTSALTLSAQTPTVASGANVEPATASLSLSGQTPTVASGVGIEPSTASLALSAQTPAVATGVGIEPSAASLTLSAQTPAVTAGGAVDVQPAAAALTLSGQTPTVSTGASVQPSTASLSLSGQTPGVAAGKNISVPLAALGLTALTPLIGTGVQVQVTVGSLTVTANAPDINIGVNILPGVSALVLSALVPTINDAPPAPTLKKFEGLRRSVGRMMR